MVSRGNRVFKNILASVQTTTPPQSVNDFFLYALFARLALSDNENVEFETKYDKKTNTIELEIPDRSLKHFDQMIGMKKGPKFKAFIDWLISSKSIVSGLQDPNFISASAFDIWYGATVIGIDDRIIVLLPTVSAAVIGYNFKPIQNNIKLNAVWQYVDGVNASFQIRVIANIVSPNGLVQEFVNDIIIPTTALVANDVFEAEILNIPDIPIDSVFSLSILRNYLGSIDLHSELVGLIGVKISNG